MSHRKNILSLLFILTSFLSISPAKEKPLEFWVNSPTDVKYYTKMIKLYKDKVDKHFEANIRHYGFVEMPDKLSIAIKTGINTPDLVQIDELFFSVFLSSEVPFADITDKVKEAGLDKTILHQRLSLFQYEKKIYGLPQSVAAVVLYYRNDLFTELKLTPAAIDTWEKFKKVGKKIASGSQSLIAMDWSLFPILLNQRGLSLVNANGTLNLDSPEVIETLEWIVDLYNQGIGRFPDRGHIFEPTFFSGDIANNEVLSIVSAGWYGLDMLTNFSPPNAKGKWRAMPLPIWDDGKSHSDRPTSSFAGQGILIYKKSKQINRSWNFIKFIMENIEANVLRFTQRNCFPAFVPAWLDQRFSQPDSLFGGQRFGNLMMDLASQVPEINQSPSRSHIIGLIREKYWPMLMNNEETAKSALKKLKKEVTSGMKRH